MVSLRYSSSCYKCAMNHCFLEEGCTPTFQFLSQHALSYHAARRAPRCRFRAHHACSLVPCRPRVPLPARRAPRCLAFSGTPRLRARLRARTPAGRPSGTPAGKPSGSAMCIENARHLSVQRQRSALRLNACASCAVPVDTRTTISIARALSIAVFEPYTRPCC